MSKNIERKVVVSGFAFCAHCDMPAEVASNAHRVGYQRDAADTSHVGYAHPACREHADAPAAA